MIFMRISVSYTRKNAYLCFYTVYRLSQRQAIAKFIGLLVPARCGWMAAGGLTTSSKTKMVEVVASALLEEDVDAYLCQCLRARSQLAAKSAPSEPVIDWSLVRKNFGLALFPSI